MCFGVITFGSVRAQSTHTECSATATRVDSRVACRDTASHRGTSRIPHAHDTGTSLKHAHAPAVAPPPDARAYWDLTANRLPPLSLAVERWWGALVPLPLRPSMSRRW